MSSDFQTIRLASDARGIATLTLARADRHNALNPQMIAEIRAALATLSPAAGTRALILAAEGASFCAGGDLAWMQAQAANSREGRIAESTELALMLRDLDRLPVPVVARVQGPAYGGGIGMMSVCDIVIAAAGSRFALTEVRLGLIPANIGPFVAARLGAARAREVFFVPRVWGPEEAQQLGLVSRVVAPDLLDQAVADAIAPVLQAAPGAVARAKALLHELLARPGQDLTALTGQALADTWETEEAAQGIAAFFARTPAPWVAPP